MILIKISIFSVNQILSILKQSEYSGNIFFLMIKTSEKFGLDKESAQLFMPVPRDIVIGSS